MNKLKSLHEDFYDYDLAVELYNRIITVASWFIIDVNLETKTIEELKNNDPSLDGLSKKTKKLSTIISMLLDADVWEGQRIIDNAKQAVCLMEQIVSGIQNNDAKIILDAANHLKSMHRE